MYRIALCDDDSRQTDLVSAIITQYLTDKQIDFELDVYDRGERLISEIEAYGEEYQIILLDIQMEQIDGIETARILRKKDKDVLITYITSYDKYTLESFEVSPFRYLLKPIQKSNIEQLIELSIEEINKKRNYLFFKIGSERHQVKTSQIISAKSEFGRKIKLYLEEGETITFYGKICDLEKELNPFNFIKVNSGTVVNLDHIEYVTTEEFIKMEDSQLISISRKNKKMFREKYYHFMEKNLRL